VATDAVTRTPRPLRIVFVVNHAAFFHSHRLPIALEAMRRGHSVVLITGQAGSVVMETAAEKALAGLGIRHVRVAFTSDGMNPLRELRGLWQALRAMREARPDLVHCASPKGILYGGLAATLTRVHALVIAVSGMGFAFTRVPGQDRRRSAIASVYRRLVGLAYRHPNKRVIVQNADDHQALVDAKLATPAEIITIPGSGVDLAPYAGVRQESKQPMVLFGARMIVDKGVHEFMEAARRLREQYPEWRFVMAGAADYSNPASVPRERLQAAQAEGSVEWLGHVEDMTPLFSAASIVCLPSYYREGMPKVLLEAAAAGCAVVTCDSTGCREAILPGVTGDLVPPRDAGRLAQTLASLIDDRNRRESYGLAGRKLAAERYGIGAVVDRILGIYEDLTSND
jgi:glycosyltransferase involved in cell wall biosynthesis